VGNKHKSETRRAREELTPETRPEIGGLARTRAGEGGGKEQDKSRDKGKTEY
jgi:hypothetical protein